MTKLTAKQFERECANPLTTEPEAIKARNHAAAAGADITESITGKEAGIKNPTKRGEYKTDIVYGSHRVSVKKAGAVQLSSAEGKTSANMLRKVMESFPPAERELLDEPRLRRLARDIEELPVKALARHNITKATERKPTISKSMLSGGTIRPQHDWDIYSATTRPRIDRELKDYLTQHPVFKHRFAEEALTGRYTMGQNNSASASHVLTPHYYKPIDDTYISDVANSPSFKARISAKSRDGVTSGTLRIDYKVTDSA
jgi:hypothetical protein